ncbi:unnamed protein product [Rotaria socialis]|uniref:Uncharacterized protein n=1 Tax=Rotaria socialis TaxID=392032 RepID=A0A820RC62_9BILA|nr:unnamed protein product [Rotaria socialis]CAF3443091.1 unnamed protein product [Rotaria socialis]CAF3482661.1 unnamed protein product [Rotaria socialis]CAF3547381.1 unnamed protein product [Rotaria socialis]CAF3593625.1 unnamed protein product [Rotaria socialis]
MKRNQDNSSAAVHQSTLKQSLENQCQPNELRPFFFCLCNPSNRIDISNSKFCTCEAYNRNNNADIQEEKLYPCIRKIYNNDTDLLEQVHVVMSKDKPENAITEPRRRHGRISKQRAKLFITEYCTRKNDDNISFETNKRNLERIYGRKRSELSS